MPANAWYKEGRANNLGNIRSGPDSFRIYDSPEAGAADAAALLRRGYRGRNLLQIGQKWAPASDGNNPGQWARVVSQYSGLPVGQVPDMEDPDVLARLLRGISWIEKEDPRRFSEDIISRGVQMALSNEGGKFHGGVPKSEQPKPQSRFADLFKGWFSASSAEAAEIPKYVDPFADNQQQPEQDQSKEQQAVKGSSGRIQYVDPFAGQPTIQTETKGQRAPIEQIANPEPPDFGTMVKAAMVRDPMTKFKVLAQHRFPTLDPEKGALRYYVRDGQIYYRDNDGRDYPEVNEGALQKINGVLADVVANSPTVLAGAAGQALTGGSVGGAAIGSAIGRELQNQIAAWWLGEPQTMKGNLTQDAIEAAGGLAGALIGKGVVRGGNAIGRAGTGPVGKLAQQDYAMLDPAASARNEALSREFGVDLTVPEITGSPTLRGAFNAVQTKPGPESELVRKFFEETRIPQLQNAIERETARISPQQSIMEAGRKGIGVVKQIYQNMKDVRARAAEPYYQAARSSGASVDTSGIISSIDDMLANEVSRKGPVKRVLEDFKAKLLREKAVLNPATGRVEKTLVPEDRIGILDSVKKEVAEVFKPGVNRPAVPADIERRVSGLLDDLTTQMDAVSPEYATARKVFSEKSKPINELLYADREVNTTRVRPDLSAIGEMTTATGESIRRIPQDIFGRTSSPDIVKRAKFYISSEDPEAWNDMIAGGLRSAFENIREGNPATIGARFKRAVWETPKQRAMWMAALEPEQYARMKDFMELLDLTDKVVYQNSQTTPLAQAGRMMENAAGGRAAAIVEMGIPSRSGWADMIKQLRYPEYAKAVTQMMLDPNSWKRITRIKRISDRGKKATEFLGVMSGVLGADYGQDTASWPKNFSPSSSRKDARTNR